MNKLIAWQNKEQGKTVRELSRKGGSDRPGIERGRPAGRWLGLEGIEVEQEARVNYVHCRTGKGKLQVWKNILDPMVDPVCRFCEVDPETGRHVAGFLS